MLLRNLGSGDQSTTLQALKEGIPTIAAFATLCGQAICGQVTPNKDNELSDEAYALVAVSKGRGIFDIRGNMEAFDPTDRFLAVCVELSHDRRLLFRQKDNARQTMMFLDGFRQLCQAGMVLHHLMRDFSLTRKGFELADSLNAEDYEELIALAVEIEH